MFKQSFEVNDIAIQIAAAVDEERSSNGEVVSRIDVEWRSENTGGEWRSSKLYVRASEETGKA
ncbi:hypothetical protein [Primorskyibacter marinus]|uniref:hypothetical protein n=1 Tax=Primorskyibacter marinus TaxID=1977320 RepID=UPI000E3015F6|nr:hypothetical protein [Primorskyibacter marinus]